ncbi:MAG: tetratricopeptide repeat protein [Defluviitaleaceae bacterium]|nr:tetratricopeptide repeat protein [Defluviitaleaceae bacterium]
MIYHKVLVNIRQQHGYSQEDFANLLQCDVAHIIALESGKEKADTPFVATIRVKLDLKNAPITELARATLMEDIYKWKVAIDYGDISKASELMPALKSGAKLSYSVSTQVLYDIFETDYYRLIGDMKSYNEMMKRLSQQVEKFNARQLHHYNCLVGAKAFVEKRYQEAIKAYVAAGRLDKSGDWSGVRFYAGLGASLSDRGYATRAVWYLEKARHLARWAAIYENRPNSRFDEYIDGYLASDLSKIGRCDEAITILERRLVIEMKKKSKEGIGYTYFSFGRVYQMAENFDKAIKNYDMALEYLNENNEAYISALYHKASTYTINNRNSEAVPCIEKGLEVAKDEYWRIRFDALMHSATLDVDPSSAEYLKNTAIPKLLSYGQGEAVVYYNKQLSEYYYEYGTLEAALKYSNSALEAQKQLHKELIERDM